MPITTLICTVPGDFKHRPCSDCGKKGSVFIFHSGNMVPEGKAGFFDEKCWNERKNDCREGLPPKPLGYAIGT